MMASNGTIHVIDKVVVPRLAIASSKGSRSCLLTSKRRLRFSPTPRNLEAITPPWLRFRIVEAPRMLGRGSLLRYRLRLFGLPIRWQTKIVDWRPPFEFMDVQIAGPYRRWEHTHHLHPVDGGTEIHDHLVYRLPYEPLSRVSSRRSRCNRGRRDFDYRARQTAARLTGDHALLA